MWQAVLSCLGKDPRGPCSGSQVLPRHTFRMASPEVAMRSTADARRSMTVQEVLRCFSDHQEGTHSVRAVRHLELPEFFLRLPCF